MRVSGFELDESRDNIMYGYIYIDSMETTQRDGSMRNNGSDDPTANRQLIFLLNYLSRYRDRHIYKIKDSNERQLANSKLWYYGSCGPFGRLFESTEIDFYAQYLSLFPLFIFPQLKSIKK